MLWLLLSSASLGQGFFSVSCSVHEQVHKMVGGSMGRTADPNRSNAHGLSESYVVKIILTNNAKLVVAIYIMNH